MIELTKINREIWERQIANYPEANFLQSWQYGEVQVASGHTVLRYEINMKGASIGLAQVIIKNARRGRYMEIAGGPLLDWNDQQVVTSVLQVLKDIARQKKCVFIRFRPQCNDSAQLRAVLQSIGCKLSPMHVTADHTSIVNLRPSLDELLERMRQQTRYEVKRAERRGVVVTTHDNSDFIDEFYTVQAATARRQGFIPPSKRYLSALYENFAGHIKLYRATKGGELLNLAIVIHYGEEAAYLEAASTMAARREPGAYAIVWQAIKQAKGDSLTRFNLWGTAPPDSPNHRYAGVTTFKHGFGGDTVAYLAPHDIVISPLRYQVNYFIESVRKKRRHL